MSLSTTRLLGMKVYLGDTRSCAQGANTAGACSRSASRDRWRPNTLSCDGIERSEMAFMVGILESLLGGIARIGPITARAAVKDRRPPQAARVSPPSSLTASTTAIR